MKKAYWLFPVFALAAFIAFYVYSRKEIEQKAADEKQKQEETRRVEKEKRDKAQQAAAEKRRLDIEAKKAKEAEEAKKKAEEEKYLKDIDDKREFAERETTRLEIVVKDLEAALRAEAEAKKKADAEIEAMRKEKEFLIDYVAKAGANQKTLNDIMTKIEDLEKERVKAAEAAAKKTNG